MIEQEIVATFTTDRDTKIGQALTDASARREAIHLNGAFYLVTSIEHSSYVENGIERPTVKATLIAAPNPGNL